jgi:hypothetical protein
LIQTMSFGAYPIILLLILSKKIVSISSTMSKEVLG